ncbi:MAG TPA: hypothetical protein VG474_06025 [Solirubrobacteraceae bacterium]|nr:hypothetical protein [Solirubrobacteraceae bacterium]
MSTVTQITVVSAPADGGGEAAQPLRVQLAPSSDGRRAMTLVSWVDRFEDRVPARRDAQAPDGVG